MEKEETPPEETSLVRIEDMTLEENQLAEQLYNNAGLDPVVDAGLKDYDERLQSENKLLNKVFGPRGSDIKGYGESVARRVAFAVYGLLNRQYGGKVGDLRSYISSLEDERDRANDRYDELMGRVIGILGDEYRELRSDSNQFMEKLTNLMGEDAEAAKIDNQALAEKLADIDGLRDKIRTLDTEKTALEEKLKALEKERAKTVTGLEGQVEKLTADLGELKEEIKELKRENRDAVKKYESEIAGLNENVKKIEAEKTDLGGKLSALEEERAGLATSLATLEAAHRKLTDAASSLAASIDTAALVEGTGEEQYNLLLDDSKVPDMVIEGVSKFIDFRKHFEGAVQKGAGMAVEKVSALLDEAMG